VKTQISNLPPEWEALFSGLNDTLKAMGQQGVTKKEAQMLFTMASEALCPAPPRKFSSPPPNPNIPIGS